ncbi:unnamed protein product [Closterium sp. NIES-54]
MHQPPHAISLAALFLPCPPCHAPHTPCHAPPCILPPTPRNGPPCHAAAQMTDPRGISCYPTTFTDWSANEWHPSLYLGANMTDQVITTIKVPSLSACRLSRTRLLCSLLLTCPPPLAACSKCYVSLAMCSVMDPSPWNLNALNVQSPLATALRPLSRHACGRRQGSSSPIARSGKTSSPTTHMCVPFPCMRVRVLRFSLKTHLAHSPSTREWLSPPGGGQRALCAGGGAAQLLSLRAQVPPLHAALPHAQVTAAPRLLGLPHPSNSHSESAKSIGCLVGQAPLVPRE